MNDINWKGKVTANASLAITATLVDGTNVSFSIMLYNGYTGALVAAAFAEAWNALVTNPAYFAVADGSTVMFPNAPVFQNGTRYFNAALFNDDGSQLTVPNVPSFPQLKANATEPA